MQTVHLVKPQGAVIFVIMLGYEGLYNVLVERRRFMVMGDEPRITESPLIHNN